MLRITQQASADAARHYYAGADYYQEGRETAGLWGGQGARWLGLEGEVSREAFERLCHNRHPQTGGPLTLRKKEDRTVGYDFTWSVPKSVSLLYALTQDERVLQAFRLSVRESMQELEAEMKTRVRKRGQNAERVTGNLVWAEFTHFTSRPVGGIPDPQLHAHCFAFNVTWDGAERQWKAGQFRDLKRDAPYWQAAFRARLAHRLQALGFAVERKRDDFEIAGIPAAALKKYARRTAVIEETAARRGITDPKRKAELGALTREGKNEQLSWDELRQLWQQRLSPSELAAVTAVARGQQGRRLAAGAEREAVDHALGHCFERQSVVADKALLAEALRRGLGAVTVEGVHDELARRPLIAGERDGRRLVTSPEIVAEEQRLIAFAKEGRGSCKPLAGFDRCFASVGTGTCLGLG